MIIRKMKNNCTKKYPKDFKNCYVETSFEEAVDEPKRDYIDAETQYSTPEEVVNRVEEEAGTEAMPNIQVPQEETKKEDNLEAIFAEAVGDDKKQNQASLFPDLE